LKKKKISRQGGEKRGKTSITRLRGGESLL